MTLSGHTLVRRTCLLVTKKRTTTDVTEDQIDVANEHGAAGARRLVRLYLWQFGVVRILNKRARIKIPFVSAHPIALLTCNCIDARF